jgi:hypothetical protein
MENATFRKWLIEQGCRFDTQHEERGEGHGTVTIHREGRTAELPLAGSTISTRTQFAKCAKHSASSGRIFPDRRAASKVSERHPELPALFKRANYRPRCCEVRDVRPDAGASEARRGTLDR